MKTKSLTLLERRTVTSLALGAFAVFTATQASSQEPAPAATPDSFDPVAVDGAALEPVETADATSSITTTSRNGVSVSPEGKIMREAIVVDTPQPDGPTAPLGSAPDQSVADSATDGEDASVAIDISDSLQIGNTPMTSLSATSVVDALTADPAFSMLADLVKKADLETTLRTAKNITVFAPTNEAFERLTDEQKASLMNPENSQKLNDVLLYHIVQATITADNLTSPVELTTVEGTTLQVEQRQASDEVEVVLGNLAKVTKVNMMAGNGTIHAIDRVLMPELSEPLTGASATQTNAETFEAAKAAVDAKKTEQLETNAAEAVTEEATPTVELK